MIGRTVSHYKILEKLGEGGMGVVYKAQDTKLDRVVALKFLSKDLLRDEEAKTRFVHEARAASALDHQNIATIYEIDEVEGEYFISMAYIEGKSIKELIKERQIERWDMVKIMDVGIQIAEGLSKAHHKGIVHRDIKSDNIMVTDGGLAKIMDFGLAKLKGVTQLTRTGSTLGTVAYMSPEQARGEQVDHRTDIWSLGVVLYEMVTGEMPFKGEYGQALIYHILNEDPKPIIELNKGIPESLHTIVNRALEKDPAQRYQSMGEILSDLQAVKKGFAVIKKPRIKTKKERKKERAVFISVAVVLALILMVLLIRHREEPIPRKIPIGVMFFDNQTGEDKYDYLRKVLANMLITDLSQSRYLRVMTFESMFDLLRSLGREDVEIIDASMGFELCKLAGANVMVLGGLMKSGNTFVLNTQVLDVNTKGQIAAHRVTGEGEGSILGNLVDDLTDKIKRGLEISVREIQQEKANIAELTTTSLKAYEYYLAGREAAFRVSNQEAIENLEKAVALDSAFIEAHDALARQYYTIGESEKALKIIEKVKSFSVKLAEQKLVEILALEAYIKKDWDLAINYYKRLVSINPEDISAHITLGMIYYQVKKMYDQGIAEFERVLELDRQAGMHYTSLPPEEREVKVSFTYNVLGWTYLRKGEYKKAQAAFKKYVARLPNQPYPLSVLGEFHLIVGNYDQAITNLKQSLKIKPDFPLTSVLFGDTYLAKGMYSQALSSYEKYLALSLSEVEKAEAHSSLGNLYLLKGEYAQAIQECRKALELDPKMIKAHWVLGLTFVKEEMFDQAKSEVSTIKELIEKTKTEEPKRYYYSLLGEVSLSKGLYQQALDNFNKAANIKSLEGVFFVNAWGEAYFKIGELNEAVEKLGGVLEINPNYAQTHYLLGLVYEKKGEKEKAKDHFQKFMEIWKDADENLPQLIDAKKRLEES